MVAAPRDDVVRDGTGRAVVARVGNRSVVTGVRAHSPLRLLVPRNHGDAAWIYLATFGGGLVDGDQIALDLDVGDGASAFLGTQSSTKIYRSPRGASQHLRARVRADALLVSIPDPVTCFAGARYTQEVDVTVDDGASVLLVEALTSGRTAYGERWAFDAYRAHLRIGPIDDALHLDPAHGPLARRLGRFDALATIVAIGPRVATIARALEAAVTAAPRADLRIAASPIGGGGVLARIAGNRVETVTRTIRSCCATLPALLGDDPLRRP